MADRGASVLYRFWPEFGQFAKVLNSSCHVEFILCPVWSSQAKSVEPQDFLEVREEHLDLLSGVA